MKLLGRREKVLRAQDKKERKIVWYFGKIGKRPGPQEAGVYAKINGKSLEGFEQGKIVIYVLK